MLRTLVTRENGNQYNTYDLMNSQNHKLYMELGKNRVNGQYYSILFDFQKKYFHRFNLGDNIDDSLKFIYEYSHYFNAIKLIKYDELYIVKLGDLQYNIICKKRKSEKIELEIIIKLAPFQEDLIFFEFEPLTLDQKLEIESFTKEKLKSENILGNFYIKEITYKYLKDSTLNKKTIPQKVDVIIDLTKILK